MDGIYAEGFRPEPYWWDDVPRDGGAGLPADALPDRADVVVTIGWHDKIMSNMSS